MEDMEKVVTLYKNRGDSNIKGLCTLHVLPEMSIFHQKYKQNLKKGHAHVFGDRDTRAEEKEENPPSSP